MTKTSLVTIWQKNANLLVLPVALVIFKKNIKVKDCITTLQ